MGGTKYNRLLGNKYIRNYKNSLAFISSSMKTSNLQYKYLQDSIIPTYHFQKSLTKLPIPKLENSIARYLNALKPILNESEWKKAEEIAKKFEANEASQLDKEIRELDKQDKHGNYISEPWFDMYLRSRDPIVLNYNPFLAFQPDKNSSQMTQAIRASNFLISSVRFLNSMRSKKLKPEIFHLNPEKSDTIMFQRLMKLIPESVSFYGAYLFNAYPLDMSQYFRLFNSTRIPKKDKDVLFTDESKRHILVIHKGNFYAFDASDEKGQILSPEEILACMNHILEEGARRADTRDDFPIGVLTAENRDKWAEVRGKLEALGNRESLNAIDSALYCIALDDTDSHDPDKLAANFLHGDPRNRWFDKNNTVIVNKNGQAGVNFEHSWGDGVAVIRFFNEIYDDSVKNQFVNAKTKPSFSRGDIQRYVRKLEFKLDDSVKSDIQQALARYNESTSRVHLKNFELFKYGRSFAKKYQLSPDSFMQSGIQVAFYKVFGKFVSTYESASTCAFKHGRTETMRPATLHTRRLAEYLAKTGDWKANAGQILSQMLECSKLHNQLVKEAATGHGFDRHLFAMKYHAVNRKKQPEPEFYRSDAYKFLNHNIISTSTLAYENILTGGFAPVVPDGFGIGYRILDDSLGACVSSNREADLKLFLAALEETYLRLCETLKKVDPPSKKKD